MLKLELDGTGSQGLLQVEALSSRIMIKPGEPSRLVIIRLRSGRPTAINMQLPSWIAGLILIPVIGLATTAPLCAEQHEA